MFDIFVINGVDYSIFVIGGIGAFLFFVSQLLLCMKAKRRILKCIPFCLALLCALYCFALGTGVFGSYSAGAISGNAIIAVVFGVITGIASVGIALAWIVYGIIKYVRKGFGK